MSLGAMCLFYFSHTIFFTCCPNRSQACSHIIGYIPGLIGILFAIALTLFLEWQFCHPFMHLSITDVTSKSTAQFGCRLASVTQIYGAQIYVMFIHISSSLSHVHKLGTHSYVLPLLRFLKLQIFSFLKFDCSDNKYML